MVDDDSVLRQVGREAEQAFRHDFTAVRRRATRRRRRRGLAAGAAAAALVVLAVLAVAGAPTLSSVGVGPPPIGPSSHASPAATGGSIPLPAVPAAGRRLFLPYYACEGGGCPRAVAVSPDAGRTWQKAQLPDAAGGTLLGITPLGPLSGALQVHDPGGAVRVLVSADGGLSWRLARTVPAVDAGPPPTCPLWLAPWAGTARLLAVDPVAATVAPVRGVPVLTDAAPVPGIGGDAIWLRGRADDGRAAMAISHDRGRTWSTHTFPVTADAVVASRDGRSAYAILSATLMDRVRAPIVAVTRDGGATWTQTAAVLPSGWVTGAAVLADGAVVVRIRTEGVAATYRSDDAGVTFTRAPDLPGVTLRVLPDGTLYASDLAETSAGTRTTGVKPNRAYLSLDNGAWAPVTYPAVP